MANPLDWSLIDGPVPLIITVLGALCLAALLSDRRRVWWTRVVPIAFVACALLAVLVGVVVNDLWRPFPDKLAPTVLLWIGVAVFAVAIAVARVFAVRWWGRLAVAAGMVVVLVTATSEVNRFFAQFPTMGAVLGLASATATDLEVAAPKASATVTPPAGQPLVDHWQPPPGLPEEGTLSEVDIPSSAGFATRRGWVYLPPAYRASPRPLLPVLVLLPGQPGGPRDWIDAGQIVPALNKFAKEHKGLTPIVVMPDHLGAPLANPMCLDSKLGKAETYLATDVPNWVKKHLQVPDDPRQWAIAGLSQGGTCALQLAVRAPQTYRSFVDMSGQREPTLGKRADTVRAAFDGDENAFKQVNPLDLLAKTRYPDTAGLIVVGARDPESKPQQQAVFEACRKAGMDVQWREVPGSHDWRVWRPALYQSLPWLAARTGLRAS